MPFATCDESFRHPFAGGHTTLSALNDIVPVSMDLCVDVYGTFIMHMKNKMNVPHCTVKLSLDYSWCAIYRIILFILRLSWNKVQVGGSAIQWTLTNPNLVNPNPC